MAKPGGGMLGGGSMGRSMCPMGIMPGGGPIGGLMPGTKPGGGPMGGGSIAPLMAPAVLASLPACDPNCQSTDRQLECNAFPTTCARCSMSVHHCAYTMLQSSEKEHNQYSLTRQQCWTTPLSTQVMDIHVQEAYLEGALLAVEESGPAVSLLVAGEPHLAAVPGQRAAEAASAWAGLPGRWLREPQWTFCSAAACQLGAAPRGSASGDSRPSPLACARAPHGRLGWQMRDPLPAAYAAARLPVPAKLNHECSLEAAHLAWHQHA